MSRPSDRNAKIDLLRAAEAVFAERGLDDAKVEDITKRAGRSKGSFYLHFPSKEDAFRQIVETMLARLSLVIDDCMPRDATWFHDTAYLRETWLDKDLEIFEFIWQNRAVAGLLLGGGGSSRFGYLIDEFAERNRAMTKRLLTWGVGAGVYRSDLDIEVASLVVSAAYDRVARELVRMRKKPDLRAWLREVQKIMLGGVGSDAFRVADPKVRPNGSARPRAKSVARPLRVRHEG